MSIGLKKPIPKLTPPLPAVRYV